MAVLIRRMFALLSNSRAWGRWLAIAAVGLSCLLAPHAKAAEDESQLKAAFLLNFARFVEWPSGAFTNSNSELTIGILGKDPFGTVIDNIAAGKTVEKRRVVVKRFTSLEAASQCQLLFISESEKAQLPEILAQLRSKPVLTISDLDKFTEQHGMIWLKRRQDMVRFAINLRAAEASGLKISSRLFKLADNARDKQ